MITRKVDKDDGLAGFSFNWVKKLANNIENLDVICLEKGNIEGLPDNVSVYSLGKENGKNRLREFWRFQKLAIKLVPHVDGVFAHQNPEYGLLISFWTKLFRKRLIAWYAHGSVSMRLRLLNFLADKIITSTPSGFKLSSNKLIILHQGIDTEMFAYTNKVSDGTLKFLSVSRISSTKNIHLMIDLVRELKLEYNKKIIFNIIGESSLGRDKKYLQKLKKQVLDQGLDADVRFLGSVANYKTPEHYQWADVFLNFSNTASLDKTILEAMSCGTLVLTSNESAKVILSKINKALCLEDMSKASSKILEIEVLDRDALGKKLREVVKNEHGLDDLMKKIIFQFR